MPSTASLLIAAGAGVPLVLGTAHLVATFVGRRLHPREPELMAAMKQSTVVISREMSMWSAWVSFNATHSYGAMLFGLVYAYLALSKPEVLFGSWFLLLLGIVALLGYVGVGWRYWFSTPRRGVTLAAVLYLGGLLSHLAG